MRMGASSAQDHSHASGGSQPQLSHSPLRVGWVGEIIWCSFPPQMGTPKPLTPSTHGEQGEERLTVVQVVGFNNLLRVVRNTGAFNLEGHRTEE